MVDYKKNINDYAKQIKSMPNLIAGIRERATMYIGYIGNKGMMQLFKEVLNNAMDEVQKFDSPANTIWVEYIEKDRMVTVADNGRGIPFDLMYKVFTVGHTSSNFEKKKGEFVSGYNGIGVKAVTALSRIFTATSSLCKEYSPSGKPESRQLVFHEGIEESKVPKSIPNKENFQGTVIQFSPDPKVMGEVTTTCEDILEFVKLVLPLMNIGTTISFYGEKINGKIIELELVNKNGVVSFLDNLKFKRLIPYIYINKKTESIACEVAFTWDSDGLDMNEEVISFANMNHTISNNSSHVIGFLDGVSTYFRNYMNKIVLANNSKLSCVTNDIKSGLKAVVSIMILEPQFTGQSKEILANAEVIPFMKDAIMEGLDNWCKNNANDLQRLTKFFKDVANLRLKTDTTKIQMLKSNISVFNDLPSKYEKPSGKTNLEFILVEGDSAMSPCRVARDHTKQGLLPLRGKVKNAMTCSKEEFFKNEECKAIYTILDCGEGRRCDVNKCKFEKIIFLGDGDYDGLHIRNLLLKMFLVYYRPLVEAGRVYAAVPPLYSIPLKNGDRQYFTNKSDFVQYVYKTFSKSNIVKGSNGKKLSDEKVIDLLTDNINYVSDMDVLSKNHAIDPNLLEFIYSRILLDEKLNRIQKEAKKIYPYLDVKQDNGKMVLDGLVNNGVETVIFHESMLRDCKDSIAHYVINSDPNGYYLNDRKVSLFELMQEFNEYIPPRLTRYKGLGEMLASELAISTLHPDFNRTLIRYTTNDIEKEIQQIRETDSNMKSLLENVDIAGFDL